MYASLDGIVCQTKDAYTDQGFSITFFEGITDKENHIRICATVSHRLGHEKEYFYDVPMDGKGLAGKANMIPIHAKASSTSYARRYLMCMIWNIPTGDDNDGGSVANVEVVGDKELNILRDLLADMDISEDKFISMLKIDKLENLPMKQYAYAKATLDASKLKRKEKK